MSATAPITAVLTPIEAHLVRYVEDQYHRATEAATQARQEAITLILHAKQVPPGSQWTIQATAEGLAVVFTPPAADS